MDLFISVGVRHNGGMILRTLGRLLQMLGLVLLPVAIVLELTKALGRSSGVSDMLVLMLFGFTAFYIGRFVEGYAGSN